MKFSFIGSGFIMPRHAQAVIRIGGEIVDIVNDAHSKDDWKKMLETTDAKYISVLTPNDLHYKMVKKAIDESKIVLCEKPLTINSEDAKKLAQEKNVFVVLQLRHHPIAKKLKKEISKSKDYEVEIDISAHRDPEYFKSWKGKKERSGGVLFNLGIHYFDMLIHLFGMPEKINTTLLTEKTGQGTMEGDNFKCKWHVSLDTPKKDQRRVFKINGKSYNFSSEDNLSYEDLHHHVYRDLIKGKGVHPKEALKSIKLVERLKNNS